jgi:hypothetical protein
MDCPKFRVLVLSDVGIGVRIPHLVLLVFVSVFFRGQETILVRH